MSDQAGRMLGWALDQARQGRSADAALAATAAVVLAPADVTVLHRAGVVFATCGAVADARHCFERALAQAPDFHHSAIELGHLAAEAGDADTARAWFDRAIAAAPGYIPGYVAAARLEHKRGNGWPALAILSRALGAVPGVVEVLVAIAEIEISHGNHAGARQRLETAFAAGFDDPAMHLRYMQLLAGAGEFAALLHHRAGLDLRPGTPQRFLADLAAGHARLAMAHDQAAMLAAAQAREASPRFASAAAVQARLAAAIAARTPFSLIRLGDGEGRFLAFLDPGMDQVMRPEERQAIGQSIWSNWFGADLADSSPAQIEALRLALSASLLEADVIGLPLAERLAADNFHRGYLAFLERFVGDVLAARPGILATDAFVNIALHQLSPFCAALLAGLDFIGVIGPHPELAGRLAAHLGIASHATWLIPGEMRLPDRPDLPRGVGHYPQRYEALLADLALPRQGAVVLVAAGLLGKIYCARVKALGGIAIDIGSVVDAWMGFATRPGQYEPAAAWRLPSA